MSKRIQYYIFFTIITVIINVMSVKIVNRIAKMHFNNEHPEQPAYDLIHNLLPKSNYILPDVFIAISLVIFLMVAPSVPMDYFLKHYDTVLKAFILRAIMVMSTIYPTFIPKDAENQPHLYSKHDLMCSGHTLCFMFGGSIVGYKYKTLGRIIKYLLPIGSIVSHQHYTDDIIVSMILYQMFSCTNGF